MTALAEQLNAVLDVAKERDIKLDGELFVSLVGVLAEDAKSVAFSAGMEGLKSAMANTGCACHKPTPQA